jgi:hypothetical protein
LLLLIFPMMPLQRPGDPRFPHAWSTCRVTLMGDNVGDLQGGCEYILEDICRNFFTFPCS